MAVDMNFKFEPIKGDSVRKGKEGQIDILAWSWGMSQTGTTHISTGGGAGKVNVQDLSLTKYVDSSTPGLMQACCSGKHFDEAVLTMQKAGGEESVEHMIITMKDVIVSSVSSGSSSGEDQQTENFTINFGSFEVAYQPQDKTGKKKGGAIKTKFDIAKNTV
jgi:type VI secretion system secreted protein Hcp